MTATAVVLLAALAACATPESAAAPASTPTATSAPTASPSASDAPATGSLIGKWTTTTVPASPVKLVYTTDDDTLNVLEGTTLKSAKLQRTCFNGVFQVSPDGRRLACSETPSPDDTSRCDKLTVAALDGSSERVIARGVSCDGGGIARWLPDSRHLRVRGDKGILLLDATTGATQKLDDTYFDYIAWSPDGRYRAYRTQAGKLVVTEGSKIKHSVAYDIHCCTGGFSVHAVSPDGRYVAVNYLNSDPSFVRGAARIVDAVTGKEMPVGVSGEVREIFFLAKGWFAVTEKGAYVVVDGKAQSVKLPRFDVDVLAVAA